MRDGQRRYLADTDFFYDNTVDGGGNPALGVGARGLLTLQRTYLDLPLQRDLSGVLSHSRDVAHAYDAWGNRTAETTYAGAGERTLSNPVYPPGGGDEHYTLTFGPPGTGSAARTTTTAYDPTFRVYPVLVTHPTAGGVTLSEAADYDFRMGTLTRVTDANGVDTTAEYDVHGRIRKLMKWGSNPNQPTAAFEYADNQRPVRYRVLQYEQPGVSGAVRYTHRFYDGLGRLTQEKREGGDNAQNIVTDTIYDGQGRPVKQSQPRYVNESGAAFETFTARGTDAVMKWTTTTYDVLGRPTSAVTPDGAATGTISTSYARSALGRLVTATDQNKHRTLRDYDLWGRLRRVIEQSGNAGTEGAYADYATTTYSYSPLDLLTGVTDAKGNATTMAYDSAGRKTAMADPDMGGWSYAYDPNGNLTSQTDAKGQAIGFTYDELDRLRTKTYPGATVLAEYRYDEAAALFGKGRRTSMINAAATTAWQYDQRGRMTRADHTLAGLAGARTFQWAYDGADRVTAITYPSVGGTAEVVSYAYDAAWRPVSACSSLAGPCYASLAAYSALGQPASRKQGNTLTTTWTYSSPLARLSEIKVGTTTGILNKTYTYDNVGNVKTIVDKRLGNQTQTFTYDHRDRLKSGATSGNTTGAYNETYAYDEIGNMTDKDGVAHAYAGSGHAHAPATVGGQPYAYDSNGNTLTGGGRTLTWTAENRPATVASGGVTESYAYDADGARVKRALSTGTTIYSLQALYEEEASGTTRRHYALNGQVVAQRERMGTTDTVLYLHGDHLGSVNVATSSTGAVVSRQEFTPFGDLRPSIGDVTQTSLDYTGQKRDGTGLLYYGARYYDPGTAKFVSPDSIVPGAAAGAGGGAATLGYDGRTALGPLTVDFHEPGFATGLGDEHAFTLEKGFQFQLDEEDKRQAKVGWGPANPQALNRYAYVLNNPVRYTDPTGHNVLEAVEALIRLGVSPPVAVAVIAAVGVAAIASCLANSDCREDAATSLRRIPAINAVMTANEVTEAIFFSITQQAKRRLAKALGGIPRSASPIAQGRTSRTRWWEYKDSQGRTKIVVEHEDHSVHVGTPKPQSTHHRGGEPRYWRDPGTGHVGEGGG